MFPWTWGPTTTFRAYCSASSTTPWSLEVVINKIGVSSWARLPVLQVSIQSLTAYIKWDFIPKDRCPLYLERTSKFFCEETQESTSQPLCLATGCKESDLYSHFRDMHSKATGLVVVHVIGSGLHTDQSFSCNLHFFKANVEQRRLLIPHFPAEKYFSCASPAYSLKKCSPRNYLIPHQTSLYHLGENQFLLWSAHLLHVQSMGDTHPPGANPKMSTACKLCEQAHLLLKVPLTAHGNTFRLRHHCFLTQPSSPASHLQTFFESPALCPSTTTSILLV